MSTLEVISNISADSFHHQVVQTPKPSIALVYMPWGAVSRGAIAVSLLKQLLKHHNYSCDIHYLNIRFAKEIGVDLYTRIAEASGIYREWFFCHRIVRTEWLGTVGKQLGLTFRYIRHTFKIRTFCNCWGNRRPL